MAEDVRTALDTSGMAEFEKQHEKPDCILLDSEYCSMGRMIGIRACALGGYTYYDAVILLELVPEEGISPDDVFLYEQKLRRSGITREEIVNDPEYIRISSAFDKAVAAALSKGNCLIHDRAVPEMVRALGYTCNYVQTYATDMDAKIVRAKVSPLYKDIADKNVLIEKIREEDNIRFNYHMAHSDTRWGDKDIYDLCINSETLGRDHAAYMLAQLMK